MKIVLLDMMETVVAEPYFDVIRRLLPSDVTPKTYFGWRDLRSFEEFELGLITEAEHMRRWYLPAIPPELAARLPRPARVRKELFRSVRYMPGVSELIDDLRQRPDLRLGLASNYAAWYTEILGRLRDLEPRMHYLFFSCELGRRKPDPEYYAAIEGALQSEHTDLRPADILLADDRPTNLAPARERGWATYHMEGDAVAMRRAVYEFLG